MRLELVSPCDVCGQAEHKQTSLCEGPGGTRTPVTIDYEAANREIHDWGMCDGALCGHGYNEATSEGILMVKAIVAAALGQTT